MKTCSIEGCQKTVKARGWCSAHHDKYLTYGNPLASANRPSLEERFWAKVEKTDGCWNWTASRWPSGYGQIRVGGSGGTTEAAHRVSYEMVHGPVPREMDIDHLCHNKACVNPNHLRAVSHKVNMENLRGAHVDSTTGVRNVQFNKRTGKYCVTVGHNGKTYRGGSHESLDAAAKAAEELRGELHVKIGVAA